MAKDYIDEEDLEQNDIPEQPDVPEEQPEINETKPVKEGSKPEKAVPIPKKKKHKKKRHLPEAAKIHENKPEKKQPETKQKRKTSSSLYWIIGIVLLIIATVIIYATLHKGNNGGNAGGNDVTWNGDSLVITEYADFQCPFCKNAFPIIQQLKEYYGDKITVEYKHFLISGHVNAEIAAEASECARDQGKFDAYHDVLFTKGEGDGTGLDKDSLKKYAKDLGLDTAQFNSCLDSGSKKYIVEKDQKEGSDRGVGGTPTFFIGNEKLVGAQLEALVPVIDKALGENSTILQDMYKNEPDVVLTVVNDKTCGAACDPSRIATVLRQFFPKMTVNTVDISTDEGKAIVTKYGLEKVPSFVLTKNIEEASKYKGNANLQTAFALVDDSYKILDAATGAARFIDPEKQKAVEEALAEQKRLAKEKLGIGDKPQIDFFVMSYCPYGNQAEEAIAKTYLVLKDKAVFVPHFVFYSKYPQGGSKDFCLDEGLAYCSMHGIQEANQDIREMCVFKDLGIGKTFDFMLAMNAKCSAQNADTCWTAVAKELNLDTDKISQCEKDNAEDYAKEEQELGNLLDVSGSPTVFINGEPYEGARTGTGFLAGLCSQFADRPAECDTVINESAVVPQGGCG